MTQAGEKPLTLGDKFLRAPVEDATTASIGGLLVAQHSRGADEDTATPRASQTLASASLGWNVRDLGNVLEQRLSVASGLDWMSQEGEYEKAIWAFHVGVKMQEHWSAFEDSHLAAAAVLGKRSIQSVFDDLASATIKTNPWRGGGFPRYGGFRDAWANLAPETQTKILEDIENHEKRPASVLYPMSERSKNLLKAIYRSLEAKGQAEENERGGSLKKLLAEGIETTSVIRGSYPRPFGSGRGPRADLRAVHFFFRPGEL